MVDEIVNLVIAMDQCPSIGRLRLWVPEECNHLVKVRDFADRVFRLDVDGFCLPRRYCAEGLDLPIVKSRGPSEVLETNGIGIYTVKLGKSTNCIMPPAIHESCLDGLEKGAHISFLVSAGTSGNDASSKILPSRNSMI